MNKFILGKRKHLTSKDRIYLEDELNKGLPFQ